MGQIDKVFGQGRLTGARVGHVYRFCPCSHRVSPYAAKRSPAYRKDLTCGKPRLSGVGRDLRRWSAGRPRPSGAGHTCGPRSGSLAMADVHRQHRGRLPGGLLHHPAARAVAVVQLSTPAARHRILRRVNHFLDDAGRDPEDDRKWPLGPGRRLHDRQHHGAPACGISRHRPGSPGAGTRMTTTATTVLVWAGVMLIGGIGSVLRFVVDRAVARRAARPFPFGTLAVNISGAALLGFLGGLALSKDAALLAGTAFVGAYTTFSTWMLETQRLGEERQTWTALANIVVSIVLGMTAAVLGQWVGHQFVTGRA